MRVKLKKAGLVIHYIGVGVRGLFLLLLMSAARSIPYKVQHAKKKKKTNQTGQLKGKPTGPLMHAHVVILYVCVCAWKASRPKNQGCRTKKTKRKEKIGGLPICRGLNRTKYT